MKRALSPPAAGTVTSQANMMFLKQLKINEQLFLRSLKGNFMLFNKLFS